MRNLAIALLLGLAVGSTATAADGWRVFGSGNDGGAYTSNADATGTVRNPNDLAFRVRGEGPFVVTWSASCDGSTRAKADRIVRFRIGQAQTCTLSAAASGSARREVHLELLTR